MRALAVLFALLPMAAMADMQPPAGYDNKALLGDWFEVAGVPNILEHDCHGTSVSIALRPEDSRLVMKIACHKGSVDGKVLPIEGLMVPAGPGSFAVRFVRLPEFGNLNLMVLWEAPDASLAVLGSPTGDVGWVWSKVPHPDEAALAAATKVLADNGYNPEAIALVDQGK